jgi:hypothetical protein
MFSSFDLIWTVSKHYAFEGRDDPTILHQLTPSKRDAKPLRGIPRVFTPGGRLDPTGREEYEPAKMATFPATY